MKTRYLMCPNCFEIYPYKSNKIKSLDRRLVKITNGREVYGICPECGNRGDFIELDKHMGVPISKFNKYGYFTEYCCEGHMKEKRSDLDIIDMYIMFKKDYLDKDLRRLFVTHGWVIDNAYKDTVRYYFRTKEEKKNGLLLLDIIIYELEKIIYGTSFDNIDNNLTKAIYSYNADIDSSMDIIPKDKERINTTINFYSIQELNDAINRLKKEE